jgi:hypothetical protein
MRDVEALLRFPDALVRLYHSVQIKTTAGSRTEKVLLDKEFGASLTIAIAFYRSPNGTGLAICPP